MKQMGKFFIAAFIEKLVKQWLQTKHALVLNHDNHDDNSARKKGASALELQHNITKAIMARRRVIVSGNQRGLAA